MSDRDEASFPSSTPSRTSPLPPRRRGRLVGHDFQPAEQLGLGAMQCACGLRLNEAIELVGRGDDAICPRWEKTHAGLTRAELAQLVDDATGA